MDLAKGLLLITLVGHFGVFVYSGMTTREKLIDFIPSLSSRVPDRDYKFLMRTYQDPLFASFQGYPAEAKYPGLYEDNEFRAFMEKSIRRRRYLIQANVILFLFTLEFRLVPSLMV